MTNNRYRLFPPRDWKFDSDFTIDDALKNDKILDRMNVRVRSRMKHRFTTSEDLLKDAEPTVFATMKIFEQTFRAHKVFSTQCAFPSLTEKDGFQEEEEVGYGGTGEDFEEKSLFSKAKDFFGLGDGGSTKEEDKVERVEKRSQRRKKK